MIALAVAAFCLLFPADAAAHSAVAGSDGFIAGLVHPFEDVLQAMATVVLGLFVGGQPADTANKASGAFIAWLAAALAAAYLPAPPTVPVYVILATSLIAGVVVAARPALPVALAVAAGGAGGIAIGLDLGPGPASLAAISFTVAGGFCSIVLLFVHTVYGARWIGACGEWPWLRIGLRIAGSWIAAVSVLLMALATRY